MDISKTEKKKKIRNFDTIRVVSAFGIVIFHFSCESNSSIKLLYRFANGGWENVFNTIFFVLSGAVCYYRYNSFATLQDMKLFYIKRWKSIFPLFYIVWLYYYIQNVFVFEKIFYSENFILTILGLDGYFNYLGNNYYIIGEWFLGAAILLYILYPFILYLYKHIPNVFVVISFALYVFSLVRSDLFKISDSRNLLSCLFCFVMGMMFVEHRDFFEVESHRKSAIFIYAISFLVSVILIFIPLPLNRNLVFHILGICLFFCLFFIGGSIAQHNILYKIVAGIGSITYATFLLHHQIIFKITEIYNPIEVIPNLLLELVVIIEVLIASKCVMLFFEWLISIVSLFRKYGDTNSQNKI